MKGCDSIRDIRYMLSLGVTVVDGLTDRNNHVGLKLS